MKTLKKVLALTLVFAMAFTMMAGAAFTDAADIDNTEAVNTLVALNVIKGQSDGSFNPNGNVTRAELAKMIYVVKNGGKDDGASYYAGLGTNFQDVKGHWAEGYIKYAASLGIINGRSSTKFDPNANVTGLEAAKMLLVTAGYDTAKEGLVGTQWSIKAASLGSENGLFDDTKGSLTAPLSRQYAAQMVYNTLDAYTVSYNSILADGAIKNDGNNMGGKVETVGYKYLNLRTFEGTLLSSGKTDVIGGTSAAKEKLVVDVKKVDGVDNASVKTFDYATDATALLGQKVKVIAGVNKDTKVYGVYASDENTVVNAIAGNVDKDGSKIKVDGNKYAIESGAKLYTVAVDGTVSETALTATGIDAMRTGENITFISNDDDEDIDLAILYTADVKKVTYVGSDNMTVTGHGNVDVKDVTVNGKIAKNDFAVVTYDLYNGQKAFAKADVVEGKISSTKDSGKEIKVGDTWYTIVTGTATAGNSVKAQVFNGFVYDMDTTAAKTEDFLLVLSQASSTDVNGGYQTKVVLADGTTKVVSATTQETAGLYTYEIDGDDYELTAVSGDYDYDASITSGSYSDKKLGSYYISDDATIFVTYETNKGKVMTGAELKSSLSDRKNVGTISYAAATSSNGMMYAKIAHIDLGSSAIPGGATANYGYIISDIESTKVDGTTYSAFTIWNGSENVEVKTKAIKTAAKGDFIKYDVNSNNEIEIDTVIAANDAVAISGYDKSTGDIQFKSESAAITGKQLDDDVVIMYVNTSDKKGVSGGSIEVADEITTDVLTKNAVYELDGDKVIFIAVDVSNKFDIADTSVDK